ncbi:MAG TPA: FG-GAP-like repeat-containing protein, partial [Isosphaeraceae bacterium]
MSGRAILGLTLASLAIAAAVLGFVAFRWRRGGDVPQVVVASLPQPGSPEYAETVGAFYGGVTALDVDANDNARQKLDRAVKLAPGEPAAWADLGLLEIRSRNYDAAANDLAKARELAPNVGAIERLLGLLDSQRGLPAAAIEHLRRAVELDPDDLRARAALAEELEREAGPNGGPETAVEPLAQVREILKRQPDNLFALLEMARLAAKRGDAEALRDTVGRIGRFASEGPPMAQRAYDALKAVDPKAREAPIRVVALRNTLSQQPAFRQGANAVKLPAGTIGEPIRQFLKMTPPRPEPSPPDEALAFTVEPISENGGRGWNAVLAESMNGQGLPTVFVAGLGQLKNADGSGATLAFPDGGAFPTPHAILAADLNSDYRLDLALAGAGGLKLYQQKEDGSFADVTAASKLDPAVLGTRYDGAWAADVEMDGDLDLVLGAREGPAVVLRNNGDGTFRPITPFEGIADLRDFAWADLDGDGDPDAALLDADGSVRIFTNDRAGRFRLLPAPAGFDGAVALAVADLYGDGGMDLIGLRHDGVALWSAARDEGHALDVAELAGRAGVGANARLFAADLDNNGATDLVASGTSGGWIALGDASGRFRTILAPKDLRVFSVADLNGDGTLDLVGLDGHGRPVRGVGRGTKGYHWQVIRPRAQKVYGDGRINSFGVGGEVEVRAGLLVQKQVIAGPVVHYGLGDHKVADVARIVWPNGT